MDYSTLIFLTVILGTATVAPFDTRWPDFSVNLTEPRQQNEIGKRVRIQPQSSIAHKRQPHPHRNRTKSIKAGKVAAGSQHHIHLFSQNFLHQLQVHLGLRLETEPTRLDKLHQRSATPTTGEPGNAVEELFPMGYPWYQNSHVPFRYRYKYSSYFYPPRAQPEDPSATATRTVELCMLARWNYELPFSELPNMAAGLLASDMMSGETTAAKARFMFELLHLSLDSYLQLESSGDVFEIPVGFDVGKCNLKKSEDPLLTSVNHLLNLYSDKSTTTELLFGLVKAAKACFGREDQPFPLELLPCLDFSFGSEQVLKQTTYRSIFSNEEICRKYLNPNIRDCVPLEKHPCSADHIEALNTFARQFYQCPEVSDKQASDGTSDALHLDEDDYGLAGSECRHHCRWRSQLLTLTLSLLALSIGWL